MNTLATRIKSDQSVGAAQLLALSQLALVFALLAGTTVFLSLNIKQALLPTVGLLSLVALVGLWLIFRLRVQLGDLRLQYLGYFWLLKLALTLFLLYAGWVPQLDPAASSTWGYDPQRFYIQAQELVENHWSPDFVSLNYVGVLYYYGFFFWLLGHNPVIPALVNAFTTLLAVLFLVRVGYEIKTQRGPQDWHLGLAMMLPEVLWFNVMTSREIILMALLTVMLLFTGRYLVSNKRESALGLTTAIMLFGLAIAALRTSMLMPVIGALILMVLLLKPVREHHSFSSLFVLSKHRSFSFLLLGAFAVGLLMVAPVITVQIGGYEFSFENVVNRFVSGSQNIATTGDVEWSERSIGNLLIPNNIFEALLFAFPRMVLYLVAPLPNLPFSFRALLSGNWDVWQSLMVALSSLIYIGLFPVAVASLIHSIRIRKQSPSALIFHIPYWFTFAAIAGGNIIIHERYRIMAALLFWGCVWLGARTCPKNLIKKMCLAWFGALMFGAVFYVSYKFI